MKTEQIVDTLRDYLDDEGFHYDFDAERNVIKLGFNLKCRLKEVKMYIKVKEDFYLVQAEALINGDPENLGELLKYLAMANFGLIVGNFEIDVEDGEIRYKTYVPCEDLETLPKPIIEESIFCPCRMFDRYGNGIAALAMGFSDAETEYKKAYPESE